MSSDYWYSWIMCFYVENVFVVAWYVLYKHYFCQYSLIINNHILSFMCNIRILAVLCLYSFCLLTDFIFWQHYCAQYSFQARSNNEVSLSAGQTVIVLQKHDLDNNTEWWLVDANGYQGYAPANYLSKIWSTLNHSCYGNLWFLQEFAADF